MSQNTGFGLGGMGTPNPQPGQPHNIHLFPQQPQQEMLAQHQPQPQPRQQQQASPHQPHLVPNSEGQRTYDHSRVHNDAAQANPGAFTERPNPQQQRIQPFPQQVAPQNPAALQHEGANSAPTMVAFPPLSNTMTPQQLQAYSAANPQFRALMQQHLQQQQQRQRSSQSIPQPPSNGPRLISTPTASDINRQYIFLVQASQNQGQNGNGINNNPLLNRVAQPGRSGPQPDIPFQHQQSMHDGGVSMPMAAHLAQQVHQNAAQPQHMNPQMFSGRAQHFPPGVVPGQPQQTPGQPQQQRPRPKLTPQQHLAFVQNYILEKERELQATGYVPGMSPQQMSEEQRRMANDIKNHKLMLQRNKQTLAMFQNGTLSQGNNTHSWLQQTSNMQPNASNLPQLAPRVVSGQQVPEGPQPATSPFNLQQQQALQQQQQQQVQQAQQQAQQGQQQQHQKPPQTIPGQQSIHNATAQHLDLRANATMKPLLPLASFSAEDLRRQGFTENTIQQIEMMRPGIIQQYHRQQMLRQSVQGQQGGFLPQGQPGQPGLVLSMGTPAGFAQTQMQPQQQPVRPFSRIFAKDIKYNKPTEAQMVQASNYIKGVAGEAAKRKQFALIVVPDHERTAYHMQVERLFRITHDFERHLAMFHALFQDQETTNKLVSIITTAREQQQLSTLPTPQYILPFAMVKNMTAELVMLWTRFREVLISISQEGGQQQGKLGEPPMSSQQNANQVQAQQQEKVKIQAQQQQQQMQMQQLQQQQLFQDSRPCLIHYILFLLCLIILLYFFIF